MRHNLPTMALLGLLASQPLAALPEGPTVRHGDVRIQGQGHDLRLEQLTTNAIIDWRSFSIAPDELVRFLQSSSSAAILNRVVGLDPSRIMGQLQANGRVFLVNPNGILFGPGASVDAGSFLATTLSLADADFLAGRIRLSQNPAFSPAALVNQGRIQVSEGGFLVLCAPLLHQDGLIVANRGQVALLAGTQATLSFDGQGLLEVALPNASPGSGPVLLTPDQCSVALTSLLGVPEEATSLPNAQGVLLHTGAISNPGGHTVVQSSGATVLTAASSIHGEQGEVRVLSHGQTLASGDLVVPQGFLEVSGATVRLQAHMDVTGGVFLLDPSRLEIEGTAGTDFDPNLPHVDMSTGGNSLGFVTIASLEAIHSRTIRLQATDSVVWLQGSSDRLSTKGPLPVTEAREGDVLVPGHIYLAPGDYHLEITGSRQKMQLHCHQGPRENGCRPAADVLFRSAARLCGAECLGVVMTGMGKDGLEGCRAIAASGGYVVSQDRESCVVWGMPRFVEEAGLAREILPLTKIGRRLGELAGGKAALS